MSEAKKLTAKEEAELRTDAADENGAPWYRYTTVQDLLATLDAERAKVEALEKLVYVPGLWRCPKCKFSLMQRNLNAADGTVTARDEPGDKCPNCAGPLWRVSERDAGNDMIDRAEEAFEAKRAAEARATAAEAEAERMREASAKAPGLRAGGWWYPEDQTDEGHCHLSPEEVVSDFYEPEPGDHVFALDRALSLPTVYAAVRVFTEAEKDARQDDEPFVMTLHATPDEACAALAKEKPDAGE